MADSTPAAAPPGVQPLFLSTPTCDIFAIKTGTTVTAEQPLLRLAKAAILADVQQRRAISDFQPYREAVSNYPGEELLIVFDAEWKYGQNFYLCLTQEAADKITSEFTAAQLSEDGAVAQGPTADGVPVKKKTKKVAAQRMPWVSLGSEVEVDMERVMPTRDLIKLEVVRARKYFGGPHCFSDRNSMTDYVEYNSYRDPNFELHRVELNMGVQATPETSEQFVQTDKNLRKNMAMQCDPRVLTSSEIEQLTTNDDYKKFLAKATNRFTRCMQQNVVSDIFNDPFGRLFDEELGIEKGNASVLQEFQSFTDLKFSKDRSITCLEWHPQFKGIVAMSCVQRHTVDEKIEAGWNVTYRQSLIIVWSITDPIRPQLYLDAPDDIVCFKFNRDSPNIVVGGCVNGQTIVWDISEHSDMLKQVASGKSDASGGRPTEKASEIPFCRFIASTAIELGHRNAVTDIHWLPRNVEVNYQGDIQTATGEEYPQQFATVSLDGYLNFWDLRFKKDLKSLDLAWKPTFRVPLSPLDSDVEFGLTKLSLCYKASEEKVVKEKTEGGENKENAGDRSGNAVKVKGSTDIDKDTEKALVLSSKFFCATEEGDLIVCDWSSHRKDKEEKSRRDTRVQSVLHCHAGAMPDLKRSPFYSDIVISVGGYSFQVWKESTQSHPVVQSTYGTNSLTVAEWSTIRPGVFFVGRQDGVLEVWDLMEQSHMPTALHSVSANAIASISIIGQQSSGASKNRQHQFVAVGDDAGTLYVLEVSSALRRQQKNEKSIIRTYFEREVKRIGNQQERASLRLPPPKDAAAAAAASTQASSAKDVVAEDGTLLKLEEMNIETVEKQYAAMEKNFMEAYAPEKVMVEM